jgi:hypothetical protein
VIASSDLLLVMYNNGHNISTSMEKLAVSMSRYIRSIDRGSDASSLVTLPSNNTSSNNNILSRNHASNMAKGTALAMETYVLVR